jgi:hypothetical protein
MKSDIEVILTHVVYLTIEDFVLELIPLRPLEERAASHSDQVLSIPSVEIILFVTSCTLAVHCGSGFGAELIVRVSSSCAATSPFDAKSLKAIIAATVDAMTSGTIVPALYLLKPSE